MPRAPRVTERQVLAALARDGWYIERQSGHIVLRHGEKPGTVAIPRHRGTLKSGTVHGIIRQAGLTVDEFIALL